MPTTVKLIRGRDSMTVEADVVELTQKHADDYTGQGMIDVGEDEDYDDLIYFEYGIWRSSR